jgi:hypothetical protein
LIHRDAAKPVVAHSDGEGLNLNRASKGKCWVNPAVMVSVKRVPTQMMVSAFSMASRVCGALAIPL